MKKTNLRENDAKWIEIEFTEIGESKLVTIPYLDEDANIEFHFNDLCYLLQINPKRDAFGEVHSHIDSNYPPKVVAWVEVTPEADLYTQQDGSDLKIIITIKGEENFDIEREDL